MDQSSENKKFFTVGSIFRSLEYKKQIENLEFKEKCFKLKSKYDPPGFEDIVYNDRFDDEDINLEGHDF